MARIQRVRVRVARRTGTKPANLNWVCGNSGGMRNGPARKPYETVKVWGFADE